MPRKIRSVQTNTGDKYRETRPRKAKSVQTNIEDRYREAKSKEVKYVQTNIGDRYKETKENIGRDIESQLVSDEDLTGQKTSSKGFIRKMGERSSIEVNSAENIILTKALIEFLEKRKRFIIRPPKPLSKDGVKMFFIKDINNEIIIFKTYYKAVNDLIYG